MNTIIWIFHNVMPWVGAWFTAMTLIFLGVIIYNIFKEKLFSYYDVTEYAIDEGHIIISFVPMVMAAAIGLIVEGVSGVLRLFRKISSTLSQTKSTID